jgi:hypothetical protein
MRADAAGEDGIAVEQQMVRRQCAGDIGAAGHDEVDAVPGGDVFEHQLQCREIAQQRKQHGIDEHRLAIEDIHRRIGDFAMHQQRQAERLHARQRGRAFLQVADAGIRIGGGAGRVQLHRMDEAAGLGGIDLGRHGMLSVRYSVIKG